MPRKIVGLLRSVALVAVIAIVTPAAVIAADEEGLAFAESTDLAISFETKEDSPTALVLLENHSSEPAPLTFSLLLTKDEEPVESNLTVAADPATIDPHSAAWIELTFAGDVPAEATDGYLIAQAGESGVAARPVSVGLDQRVIKIGAAEITIAGFGLPGGPVIVMVIALVLAVIVVLPTASGGDWAKAFGKPKWTWDSWASTFTAVGALFGTFLGGDILPEESQLLGAGQYAGLSLLFGALVVLTAFAFEAVRGRGKTTKLWVFLLACLVLFTAAFGQLLTLAVLIGDSQASLDSDFLAWSLLILGLIAIGLMVAYGRRAVAAAAEAGKSADNTTISGTDDAAVPPWVLP